MAKRNEFELQRGPDFEGLGRWWRAVERGSYASADAIREHSQSVGFPSRTGLIEGTPSENQRFPYKLVAADCLAHFQPEVIPIALRAVLLNSEAVGQERLDTQEIVIGHLHANLEMDYRTDT